MRAYPHHFDGDPRFDVYMFLFYFQERLYMFGLVDSMK